MHFIAFSLCWLTRAVVATDPLSASLGLAGLSAMGRIGQMAPVSYVPNQNLDVQMALQDFQSMPFPSPPQTTFIDPSLLSTEDACERVYEAPCPVGFVSIGDIYGDGARCAADPNLYSGKCSDRPIKFLRLTRRAKRHWSMLCTFQWPCQSCKKDYSIPCPMGWDPDVSQGTTGSVCIARRTYDGPCEGTVDFSLFNDATKSEWSSYCQAYWPCQQP